MPPLLLDITSEPIEDSTSPEFHLLELFVLSPWFSIQSNLSVLKGVVEHVIGAISLLQPSPRGLSTSSALTIVPAAADASSVVDSPQSILLNNYANLLLAALAPVFCSSVPLSKHYLDLYPPPAQDSQGPQDIVTTQCLRPSRLEDLGDTLLKFLTLSSRSPWNSTPTLQSARLDLISLLLCQQLLSEEDEEGQAREATLAFVKDLLAAHSEALFTQIFSHTALPTCPLSIRQKSIHLLSHVIRCSCHSSPEIRILPYSLRSTSCPSAVIPAPIIDLLFEHLTAVCLNDGSDDVRLPSLEALLQLIPFLKREKSEHHPSSAHFDGLVDCLLTHSLIGNPTEEIVTHLDLLLRSIAILDPAAFESLVRSKFSSLSVAQQASSSISGFFSGLIDHADVLIQFQQLKLSSK
jgi:hypothetical protein